MKTRRIPGFAFLPTLALTLLAPTAVRADYTFHVSLDTTGLVGATSFAPYSLDFQLNGDQGNLVNISDIVFGTGGSPSGNPNLSGDASGSLGSGVTLNTATNFFNDFNEQFTPGSLLQFDVQTTTNFTTGTPDALSFAILDNTLTELPTTGSANQLFQVDLNGATPTISTYSGLDPLGASVTVTTAAVPEPGFYQMSALLALGSVSVWRMRRHKR